jgi:hypothetical protein
MKRTMLIALLSTLPLALCVPVLQAQGPAQAIDASKMPESGPAVVGGTGATVGPNSKNQAVMPMPGIRQDEELSELPRDRGLPVPEVRPVPGPPRATR